MALKGLKIGEKKTSFKKKIYLQSLNYFLVVLKKLCSVNDLRRGSLLRIKLSNQNNVLFGRKGEDNSDKSRFTLLTTTEYNTQELGYFATYLLIYGMKCWNYWNIVYWN